MNIRILEDIMAYNLCGTDICCHYVKEPCSRKDCLIREEYVCKLSLGYYLMRLK